MRRQRKKAERPAVTEGWGGEGPEEELKLSERLEIILDYETMRNNLIVDFVVVVVELKHMMFGSVLLQDDGKVGGSLGVGRPRGGRGRNLSKNRIRGVATDGQTPARMQGRFQTTFHSCPI